MNREDSNDNSSITLTEPLIMSQSFNMVPIQSGSNFYTKNLSGGDSRKINNKNKSRNDSDLTQLKVIEGGISQTSSPLIDDSDLTQAKVIEGTNTVQAAGKEKATELSKAKPVKINSMPNSTNSNAKETPIQSGTTEESTHTEKSPDMPRGASFPGANKADNHNEWDYLIPIDPPPYPHVDMPVSSTSDPLPNSTHTDSNFGNTGTGRRGHQHFQRSDSGLGSDQSERGSGVLSSRRRSPNSPLPKSPGLTTHHEQPYEDVENCRQGSASSRTASTSVDNRLQYPYYTPVLEDQTSVSKPKKSRNCQGCCLVLTCFIILLISLAALTVSIFVLITRPNTTDSNEKSVVYVYNVTADGQTSLNLTQVLSGMMKAEFSSLKEELIQDKEKQLQTLEHKLDTQIANISRVPGPRGLQGPPGPQGPKGIANFSACTQDTKSATEISLGMDTEVHTVYLPEIEFVKDFYAHFAYCKFDGATVGIVEDTDGPRFRCMCKGAKNQTTIYCHVVVWMCPRGI